MNIGVHIYFIISVFIVLGKCLGVEFLDQMVVLVLIFWENFTLISIVATMIYIPPIVWESSPFSHILANTCSFLSF